MLPEQAAPVLSSTIVQNPPNGRITDCEMQSEACASQGEDADMAKLVFGMNQSLDGYVDHTAFAPGPALFRHFVKEAQAQAGSVYGRVMYENHALLGRGATRMERGRTGFCGGVAQAAEMGRLALADIGGAECAACCRDLAGAMRRLKAERDGEIEVAGPALAHSLTELGLIDEYRIYLHPVVVGQGKRYFAGPRPPLKLVAHDPDRRGCDPLDLRSRVSRPLTG